MAHRRPRSTRIAGLILVVAGLVVAGIGAWQLWGTGIETARIQHAFLKKLAALPTTPATINAPDLAPLVAPAAGQPFMIITIPRMHVRAAVVEGVAPEDIAKGPGHVPGTALPGGGHNIAIAGHRATHGAEFAAIETLQVGDHVMLRTKNGVYTYSVIAQNGKPWRLVQPTDLSVLRPGSREILTLISCHPQWASTNRVIVLAVPVRVS